MARQMGVDIFGLQLPDINLAQAAQQGIASSVATSLAQSPQVQQAGLNASGSAMGISFVNAIKNHPFLVAGVVVGVAAALVYLLKK